MTSASDTTTSTACEARIDAKFAEDRNVPGRRMLKITITTTQAIGSASASNDFPESTERRRRVRRWRVLAGGRGDLLIGRHARTLPSIHRCRPRRHRCVGRAAQAVLGYPFLRHVRAGEEPDEAAAGDHADPVADRGQLLVVGAGADRRRGGGGGPDHRPDLLPRTDVDALGGLVEQQHPGLDLLPLGHHRLLLVATRRTSRSPGRAARAARRTRPSAPARCGRGRSAAACRRGSSGPAPAG